MITPRSARWLMLVQGLVLAVGSIALLRTVADEYAFRVAVAAGLGTAIVVLGLGLSFRLRFLRLPALLVEGVLGAFLLWGLADVGRDDFLGSRTKLLVIIALLVGILVCVVAMSLLLSAWEPKRTLMISEASQPVGQWLESHQGPAPIPPAYYPQNAAVDAAGRPVSGPAAAAPAPSGPGFAHGAQAEGSYEPPGPPESAWLADHHGGPGAWPGTSAAAEPVSVTAALPTPPPPRPAVRRGPAPGSIVAAAVVAVVVIGAAWAGASAATTYRNEPDRAFAREVEWVCEVPGSLADPSPPTSPVAFAAYVDDRVPYLERADERFAELVAPPAFGEGWPEFRAGWRRMTDSFVALEDPTVATDPEAAAALVTQAQAAAAPVDRYAATHGLDACVGWLDR